MESTRTIFITAFHSLISRNILETNALATIARIPHTEVVILVPNEKREFFEAQFARPGVRIEGVDYTRIQRERHIILLVRIARLFINAHYPRYRLVEKYRARRTFRALVEYVGARAIMAIFGNRRLVRALYRRFDRAFAPRTLYAELFERYQPALLFATDVFNVGDIQLMRLARRFDVPIVGMVRSWDNCYSKGVLPVIPDQLIVNTELLKDEAVTLHDVPAAHIKVVGLPQFDLFINISRTPREAFFRSIGADPSRKLVLLAPAGAILSDTDWQVCDAILKAEEGGRFTPPIELYVRNHPHHPADLSKVAGRPHLIIVQPGQGIVGEAGSKATEFTKQDTTFLADLLYHADVVIYTATTLGIDSAVFDKSQIIVDFDGYETKPYAESVVRYHDEDHMKKLIATGGVAIAHSAEELVEHIRRYLADPALDHEGRARIVTEQLYRLDGGAGDRVGEAVCSLLVHLVGDV